MRRPGVSGGLLLSLLVPLSGRGAAAQSTALPSPTDTAVVAPIGARYAAGWFRKLLLGRDYRSLWTTPISIPVLDLASYGGGLTPVSRGHGQQTASLRFRAADGREYYFRSIDKDPTPSLPPEMVGTIVAGVVQDQTSSAHPTGPLIVAPLLAAAGVLHGEPQLFILPDDARLGEFRPAMAGLIGMLEPRIAGPGPGLPAWGGADEIIIGDELFRRVEASPDDRVDSRALLKARLVDLLVGDWDRHRDQWSWARFGDATPRRWQPVPRDRDFAMVRYDGLLLHMARVSLPQLLNFGPDYPDVLGLTWNGRELDRHFLMDLEWPVWDSVAAEVRTAITDSVIDAAVRRIPPEHFAESGLELIQALKHRRDNLPRVARRFYRMLADQAEVYGTDADETATLDAIDDHTVELALYRGAGAPAAPEPYLRRRFHRDETRELRLFLRGGNDSIVTRGRLGGILVRVIGGDGQDRLIDSSRTGRVRMYDADAGTLVSSGVHLDHRPYTPPPKRSPTEIPVRDWGHRWTPSATLSGGPDVGVFFGMGRTLTVYGFRKLPFASRHRFRAGIATGPWTYRADYLGQFRGEDSRAYREILIRASGIEVLRFHGFGNEQPATGSAAFYRATQKEYAIDLSAVLPLGRHGELAAGPTARFVSTDQRANRLLSTLRPYGDGDFGEVGARLSLTLDSRSRPTWSTPGVRLTVAGSAYPGWWDVRSAYGEVHGEATTYLSVRAPLDPTLVLRLGGKKLWGPYPYFDAAFIGGYGTVRLGRENRYAGDASAFANSEMRLSFGRPFEGAPGEFGIFGLADAGRVFLAGESSRKWHGAAGGGVWFSILDRANTVNLAVARSEERTAFYFQASFGF